MLAIVAGYPDGNDCDVLRDNPAFKMALDRPPLYGSGAVLAADRFARREPGAADGALSHG